MKSTPWLPSYIYLPIIVQRVMETLLDREIPAIYEKQQKNESLGKVFSRAFETF